MPVFTRSRIADREMFERYVGRLLERLRLQADGRIVDLTPVFDQLVRWNNSCSRNPTACKEISDEARGLQPEEYLFALRVYSSLRIV
ncbi:hypothetical protein EJ02DRAFT_450426 [Clathrospora elynae]|uniref:Uncharacterized protein n=1 Tax=Clathrospora elynae TaxID=706981 RepID=A0A6A5T4Q6_9PLEO|nr:hypothetical protein EJ02DRAFT_450426 [Clathrospora elynae]